MLYYGLSYNVSSLSGNIYVNNVINGAVEFLSYMVCIAFMDVVGRRRMTGGLMIFGMGRQSHPQTFSIIKYIHPGFYN